MRVVNIKTCAIDTMGVVVHRTKFGLTRKRPINTQLIFQFTHRQARKPLISASVSQVSDTIIIKRRTTKVIGCSKHSSELNSHTHTLTVGG